MFRARIIAGFALLASCGPPYTAPKGLCDLPTSLRTWEHTTVRLKGAMMGGFNHGFTLFAEECPSRHIRISDWPDDTADGAALNGVLEKHFADIGVLRVDVSGRITADRTLSISKVHHFQFQPMTEREEADWWRSTRN